MRILIPGTKSCEMAHMNYISRSNLQEFYEYIDLYIDMEKVIH